jgi:hypothetical protein
MDLAILRGIFSTVTFMKNQRFKNLFFLLFVLFSLLPEVQAQISQRHQLCESAQRVRLENA